MSKPNNVSNYRKSLFGELNLVSTGLIALMIAVIIVCIAIYGVLIQSPAKKVKLVDDAEILTPAEEDELLEMAKKLSKRDDINVVIVTTRDKDDTIGGKGNHYSNSDDDCAAFAGDYYAKQVIKHNFRDNSGICILVDLSLDYSGGRFFWLYTYGTAYYAISDDSAQDLFHKNKSLLQQEEYGDALIKVMKGVAKYDFDGTLVHFLNNIVLVIPVILAAVVTYLLSKAKKLDTPPKSVEYLATVSNKEFHDVFLRKDVSVTHVSSSSGSGGGHGGGGGGHSGGGGGRF